MEKIESARPNIGPPAKDARVDRLRALLAKRDAELTDAEFRELVLIYLRRKFQG